MANGIEPAAPLVPAPFGLLSTADVTVTAGNATWIRGFAAQYNSRPQLVRILTRAEGIADNGTVYEAASDADLRQSDNIDPFFIEIISKSSGMGYNDTEKRAQLVEQLETVTGKAVEFELWTGVGAISDGAEQPYLQKDGSNGANIIGPGNATPKKALSLIEGAIADSPMGAGGVIHITRELASILTLQGAIKPVDNEDTRFGAQHLETVLGTKVVVGTGYTGDGPGAGNTATDDVQWIYGTGPVSVFLGEAEVTNEDLSRSFTPSSNDVNVSALRAAAVYFDPSIFYAVQVALPAAP
jgi:hypothetical protein